MKKNTRKARWMIWWVGVGLWLGLIAIPVSSRFTRFGSILLVAALWLCWLLLLWRRRWRRYLLLGATAAIGVFLILPGSPENDRHLLRRDFVTAMRRYRHVRYVTGGESFLGLDCSGLIRRGLIDACVWRGLAKANPQLVRYGIGLWWNDCSAAELGDWRFGLTTYLRDEASINEAVPRALLPGDLAVTANGEQILAYVGKREWIEADPRLLRVVTVKTPNDENIWFKTPVRIVRWNVLR